MTFYVRLTNEEGYQTPLQEVNVGSGTGGSITLMIDLQNGITGKYIVWEMSGPKDRPFQLVEFTPYPITNGEVQGSFGELVDA
jgi:hypothetical protein